jgi:tetratricopeptide (TPR) repeat protein
MKIPSWTEFNEKTSTVEKLIYDNVQSLKDNHPILDGVLKQSFSFLPAPFNTYAQGIYNAFAGSPLSPEAKSDKVLKYINTVKNKGESYYYSEGWEEDITKLQELTTRAQTEFEKVAKTEIEVGLKQYEECLKQLELSHENSLSSTNEQIDYNSAKKWFDQGFEFTKRGNYKMALEFYDKALNIDPNYILAQRGRETIAIILKNQHDMNMAIIDNF